MAIFPTCVGVFPASANQHSSSCHLPHMRGGVSQIAIDFYFSIRSSPHAWGCFTRHNSFHQALSIFPTCVGVFLWYVKNHLLLYNLPHMRGGVSRLSSARIDSKRSSPHAWGCFLRQVRVLPGTQIFPTCVGVFPNKHLGYFTDIHLPHMRGGVSISNVIKNQIIVSSPHAWGCFLNT